jgi:hypothetical protein
MPEIKQHIATILCAIIMAVTTIEARPVAERPPVVFLLKVRPRLSYRIYIRRKRRMRRFIPMQTIHSFVSE